MLKEQEKTEKLDKEAKKEGFLSKFHPVEIAAYIAVGISAIATSYFSASKKFFDHLQKNKLFDDLVEQKREAYRIFNEEAKKSGFSFGEALKRKNQIEGDYSKKLNEGLKTKFGITNIWQKLRMLKWHTMAHLLLTVTTILGIAGFAIFSIRKDKNEKESTDTELARSKENLKDFDRDDAYIDNETNKKSFVEATAGREKKLEDLKVKTPQPHDAIVDIVRDSRATSGDSLFI